MVELRSPSDRLPTLQRRLRELIRNGAQLGWLIDPYHAQVHIYRPGISPEQLDNPTTINGDPVLPGFVFNIEEIW